MALNKAGLVTALTGIFSDVTGKAAAQKASEIADAIDAYVKTGAVSVTVSTAVTGTATPTGVVTGSGDGSGTGTIA